MARALQPLSRPLDDGLPFRDDPGPSMTELKHFLDVARCTFWC